MLSLLKDNGKYAIPYIEQWETNKQTVQLFYRETSILTTSPTDWIYRSSFPII